MDIHTLNVLSLCNLWCFSKFCHVRESEGLAKHQWTTRSRAL